MTERGANQNQQLTEPAWAPAEIAEARFMAYEVPNRQSFRNAVVWLEQSTIPDVLLPELIDRFSLGLQDRFSRAKTMGHEQPVWTEPATQTWLQESVAEVPGAPSHLTLLCDRLFDGYDKLLRLSPDQYRRPDPETAGQQVKGLLSEVLQSQDIASRQKYLSHLVRDRLDWHCPPDGEPQAADAVRLDRVREIVYEAGFSAMKVNLVPTAVEQPADAAPVEFIEVPTPVEPAGAGKGGIPFGYKAALTVVATAVVAGGIMQPAAAANTSPQIKQAISSTPNLALSNSVPLEASGAAPIVVVPATHNTKPSPAQPTEIATPTPEPSTPAAVSLPEATTAPTPDEAPTNPAPAADAAPSLPPVTPAGQTSAAAVESATVPLADTTTSMPSSPAETGSDHQSSVPTVVNPSSTSESPTQPSQPTIVTPGEATPATTLTADQVETLAQGSPDVLTAQLQQYVAAKYGVPAAGATDPAVQRQLDALEAQLATTQPADHAAFVKATALAQLLGQYPDLVNQIKQDGDPVLGSLAAGVVGSLDVNPLAADNSVKQVEASLGEQSGDVATQHLLTAALAAANVQLTPGMGDGTVSVPLDTSGDQPTVVQPAADTNSVPLAVAPVHHIADSHKKAHPSHHQAPHGHNHESHQQALIRGLIEYGVPHQYAPLYVKYGNMYPNTSPILLAAQGKQESNYDPHAGSNKGAKGIAQFIDSTWEGWKNALHFPASASPWDPEYAIHAQAAMMNGLMMQAKQLGYPGSDLHLALAGYNAGMGAVHQYHGVPPYSETQGYVSNITAIMHDIKSHVGRHTQHEQHASNETHGVPDNPEARANYYAHKLGINRSDISLTKSSAGIYHFVINEAGWRKLGITNLGGYPASDQFASGASPRGFYLGECVDYVDWKLDHAGKGTFSADHWGGNYSGSYDGGYAFAWQHNAHVDHLRVDHTPAEGAVLQWNKKGPEHSSYGHVGYIEKAFPKEGWAVYSQMNYDGNSGWNVEIISPQYFQEYGQAVHVIHTEGAHAAQHDHHHGQAGHERQKGHDAPAPQQPSAPEPNQPAGPPTVQPSAPADPSVPIDTGEGTSSGPSQPIIVTPGQPAPDQPTTPATPVSPGQSGQDHGNGNQSGPDNGQANDGSSRAADVGAALVTMFSN